MNLSVVGAFLALLVTSAWPSASAASEEDLLVLPPSLECSNAHFAVPVDEAATEGFGCPAYFSAMTCCTPEMTTSVVRKLTDMLDFGLRVLSEQGEALMEEVVVGGGSETTDESCGAYHQHLFSSRIANFKRARSLAESGLEMLQGSVMHLLCAACFVCSMAGKTEQIDKHSAKALLSIQQQMVSIFAEQVQADMPPDPLCELHYVASLREGPLFPSWGRFVPEMHVLPAIGLDRPDDAALSNQTVAAWMDRVLSLLLELPATLFAELAILRLVFFYVERPQSDAFALLHGPVLADPDLASGTSPYDGSDSEDAAVPSHRSHCYDVGLTLLLIVPHTVATEGLRETARSFLTPADEENASSVGLIWVVSAADHVQAVANVSQRRLDSHIIWRRFHVLNVDTLAGVLCADHSGSIWLANYAEVKSIAETVAYLRRVEEEPNVDDLRPSNWPAGIRPARGPPAAGALDAVAWRTSSGLAAYLASHAATQQAMLQGGRSAKARILVYTCTALTMCGGHGDRLNGMLGAAVLALLSGRSFYIDASRPVPLSLVLQPKHLDWRLYGSVAAMPVTFNFNDDLASFEADPRRVLDDPAEVLRVISNQRLTSAALRAAPQQATELGLSGRARLHGDLFKLLFEPAPALRARLAARKLPRGAPLIGIHFRAGDQTPQHWKDPARHDLSELDEFLDCAQQLEARQGWNAHFLLFADTDRVLQSPRVIELQELGKLSWPATADSMIHLDRSPSQLTVRGLLQVWADWWTLAFDVDAMVLCHSGFGATALEIGRPNRPAVLGKGCVWADASTG